MLLREVEYVKPSSLADALAALGANDGARALAGGQTIINVMKARAASPDVLVDLNGLEDLKGIELGPDGTLSIGPMTTYSELMASAEARARPILGVYMTAVQQGELLTRITIPAGKRDGFAAVTLGVDGTCIANAAASMNGSLRIALGCVDAVPVLVEAESADDVRAAVRAAKLDPPSDVHASSEYRAHLAEVLAERAARQAMR